MSKPTHHDLAQAVLELHGRTYASGAGIRLKNTPAPLFQLLTMSLLLSARIAAGNAIEAARALWEAKLTTPRKMADASWQDRVDVISQHGYKRYDESGSRMLGETSELLLEKYGGDLRQLRDEADRDVSNEHRLLQQFQGIGDVGADIFLREVQGLWDEAFPYVDDRVSKAAQQLGLPSDPAALARLSDQKDFPRLTSGLVRVDLADAYQQVRDSVGES